MHVLSLEQETLSVATEQNDTPPFIWPGHFWSSLTWWKTFEVEPKIGYQVYASSQDFKREWGQNRKEKGNL